MYSNEYKCPFCGTIYYKIDDVAECTAKCAEKKKKEETASAELNKLRQEKYKKLTSDLAAQKEEINKIYNSLKMAEDKYNEIANKISKIDGKTTSHCYSSISFDTEKTINKPSIGKPRLRTWDELEEINLNELVDKFLEIF